MWADDAAQVKREAGANPARSRHRVSEEGTTKCFPLFPSECHWVMPGRRRKFKHTAFFDQPGDLPVVVRGKPSHEELTVQSV